MSKSDLIKYLKKLVLVFDHPPTTRIASLKCFWTYPFCHIWYRTEMMSSCDRKCYLCNTRGSRDSYDGNWFRDLGLIEIKEKNNDGIFDEEART